MKDNIDKVSLYIVFKYIVFYLEKIQTQSYKTFFSWSTQPSMKTICSFISMINTTVDGELSGRVLDSRSEGRGFEPHRRHCVVSFSKKIKLSLVLVQPRKTLPFITERLLMGRKESNQKKK